MYSNDQIEARYLLTTTFMERLIEVEKAFKRLLPYEIEELKIYIKSLAFYNPELNQSLHLLQ